MNISVLKMKTPQSTAARPAPMVTESPCELPETC